MSVGDATSLTAAIAGGAERIELCSALELGGLTPSAGLMRLAAEARMPVYALIRPRGGDFVFNAAEIDAMRRDIDAVRETGLAGVALGASLADGRLDEKLLRQLAEHAAGLGTSLHRAIDLAPDVGEAIELAVALRFERALTSGGARSAVDGVDRLAASVAAAGQRLAVMAGAGLTPHNVGTLLAQLPLNEVHSSCSKDVPSRGEAAMRLGFAGTTRRQTSAAIVAAFKAALK